ncbi:3841_t:CDS:1, partial [Gigaspora rosea]
NLDILPPSNLFDILPPRNLDILSPSKLLLLPPSKLNLDEWKRFYSNHNKRPDAINWFWDHYDSEGYSIWRVDYKYNDELTKIL